MRTEIIIGVLIPFVCTSLGSALVFFFKEKVNESLLTLFLSLAAGIMISASFFSLILPALDASNNDVVPIAIGFLLGGLFLAIIDKLMPHLHPGSNTEEGVSSKLKRSTKMILAVTLHNIPEGMSVGLLYGIAMQNGSSLSLASALALSIGIGIQNIPEGAAISLPLKKEGISNLRSFIYGTLSGIVEPIGAIIAIAFISIISAIMPWLLSFAAGAMIYVVVEELVPEVHADEHSLTPTLGIMLGFVIMMVLDVTLG